MSRRVGLRDPDRLGAKPDGFSRWLFAILNAEPSDDLHDLYPGTGAVTESWDAYRRQLVIP